MLRSPTTNHFIVRCNKTGNDAPSAKSSDVKGAAGPMCTEISILIDCVTETRNVGGDDRAAILLPDTVRLTVVAASDRMLSYDRPVCV